MLQQLRVHLWGTQTQIFMFIGCHFHRSSHCQHKLYRRNQSALFVLQQSVTADALSSFDFAILIFMVCRRKLKRLRLFIASSKLQVNQDLDIKTLFRNSSRV